MSTRFLQGVHNDGRRTLLYDEDSPLDLVVQLVEDPVNWTVNRLNHRGELLDADYSWRDISVVLTMGGLLDLLLIGDIRRNNGSPTSGPIAALLETKEERHD